MEGYRSALAASVEVAWVSVCSHWWALARPIDPLARLRTTPGSVMLSSLPTF